MGDTKENREKQAAAPERRRRERELEEERTRADEAEPVHDDPGEHLGDLDEALDALDYPVITEELIDTSLKPPAS